MARSWGAEAVVVGLIKVYGIPLAMDSVYGIRQKWRPALTANGGVVRITEPRNATVDTSRGAPGSPPTSRLDASAVVGCRFRRSVTPDTTIGAVARRGRRYRSGALQLRCHARRPVVDRQRSMRSADDVSAPAPDRAVIAGPARSYDGGAPGDVHPDVHHDRPVGSCRPSYVAIGGPAVCAGAHATLPAVAAVSAIDLHGRRRGGCSAPQGEG
jgi:hypothetical protein